MKERGENIEKKIYVDKNKIKTKKHGKWYIVVKK